MIIGSPCPYVCDNKSPLSGYCNSTACINPQFNGSGTYVLKTCEYCNKATYMKGEETMESPYYEMTHDFEEENRNTEMAYNSGYLKGYHDALIKKQEAKSVTESTNMYTGLPITHCPKCGIALDRYLYGRQHEGQINYCPMCGQAVKFDD